MLKKMKLLIVCLFITSHVSAQSPNIIFILGDDLGYGDVGVYGQKLIRTPNIDQLAREGVIFTDFHSGAPVCSPSRSVLMTGLHSGHTTIRGNMTKRGGKPGKKGDQTIYRANLSEKDFTIGNLLQQSGYTTAMAGKWHLDGYDTLATPYQRGFDNFSGWLISYPKTYANGYWPTERYVNGNTRTIEKNEKGNKGYYMDQIATDEAIAFLSTQKNAKKPFMLMVNYNNPHSPLDVPDESAYADKDWPKDMKTYAAMVSNLDGSVGKLKKCLMDNGLAKNTIVFFCSDNGPRSEPTRQLSAVAEFFNSNGDLKGYKRDMYEGGIRVPMIVWAPGIVEAGNVNAAPAYFADIMPTFADIAESKVKYTSDGTSIYTLAKGKKTTKPRFLYWEFFENGFEQAVRYGQWKAIKRDGKIELYDLETDLGETKDVSVQNKKIVQKIEAYLITARTESEFWPVD